MQVEEGKTYLDGMGVKVAVVKVAVERLGFSVIGRLPNGNTRRYTRAGKWYSDGEDHRFDLVREADTPLVQVDDATFKAIAEQMPTAAYVAEAQRRGMGEIVASEPPEHIMQFFAFEHLAPTLRDVSRQFADLANLVVTTSPRNPERSVALRKLLEAKDAAVRARLAK